MPNTMHQAIRGQERLIELAMAHGPVVRSCRPGRIRREIGAAPAAG